MIPLSMTISWYGHSCFRLESKGTSVLIDPFDKAIGLRPPRHGGDIILVSHEHSDHNNIAGASAEAFLVRGPGEYEKSGVYIEGIKSYHDNSEGKERGLNTIYIIRFEEIRLCHLGDLGQNELTEEQIKAIGEVDVLFVPVGGNYTIDGIQAAKIVGEIEPKIIVPMHYKIPGLTIDIDGPQKFLKEIGLKPEEVETLKIAKKGLPTEEVKLVMFKV